MAKYEVLISETALRALRSLPHSEAEKIKQHLQELREDPFKPRPKADIKKLAGFGNPDVFRLRIGDFRAIYSIFGRQIKVAAVFRREKGYAWME